MSENTALARQQHALATTGGNPIAELHSQFGADKYNLLAPVVHMAELPAGTKLAVREIRVDPREAGIYTVSGKLALGKTQLDRIASAAGITWVSTKRVDDRKHPHYCEFTVRAKVTDFDGTVREAMNSKTIDLRDDAGEGIAGKDLAGMSPKQLAGARKFITEMCESKAMNRAIATILALRRSFTAEELRLPFVVPKLVPDTSDPMAKRMTMASMFNATQTLFGEQPGEVVDQIFEEVTPSPLQPAGEAVEVGALSPAPAASEPPDLEEPPHDPTTGEVTTPTDDDIKVRSGEAWRKLCAADSTIGAAEWRALVLNATGKTRLGDLGWDDLTAIDNSVAAYAKGMGV